MAADLIAFPIETAGIGEPGVGEQIVAALPSATTSAAGKMSAADKAKLNSIAAGATANSTDVALRDRATHTGVQAAATISDFIAAVRAQIEAALLQGSNITITPAGSGATRTLTIAGLAGGSGTTNLGYNTGTRFLSSSSGSGVTLPLATALTDGLQSTEDYTLVRSAVQPGQNPAATVFAIADSGSVVINPANGALQTWTLGANRTPSATFAEGASCTIHLTAGAFSVNWATVGVTWLTGTAPVLATSGITPVTLYRVNGTIYGGAPVDLDGLATDLNLAAVAASGAYADLSGRPDLSLKADLVGGVIPTAQLPALAVTEFLGTVASQSAMLALTGQRGDWAIRSDTGTTWVLTVDGGSLLAHWQQLSYPAAPVSTVNGQAGAVVLAAADVGAQPADSDLTAIAALTTTAFGRSFLALADAAAGRTLLGLGSAATSAASAFAAAIASGTAALGTAAIASGASATTVTVTATGVTSADIPDWGFNANPNAVTGYSAASTTGCLVITAWCTTDAVNFLVSNPTAASVTPGALTLNWRVRR